MNIHSFSQSPSIRTGRRGFLGLLGALIAAPKAMGATPSTASQRATSRQSSSRFSIQDEREEWLREWADKPRIPITDPESLATAVMLILVRQQITFPLYYHGGSMPGAERIFTPDLVFRHEGGDVEYVSGYCHRTKAPRILRIDRIDLYGNKLEYQKFK